MSESGVVRTNISVPRELKARMDKVKAPPNWSAIAADAFWRKLLELESQKEVSNLDDVIARLKAANELESNQSYQDGVAAGKTWTEQKAAPRELRALANLSEEAERDSRAGDFFLTTYESSQGIAQGLYEGLHPRYKDIHWVDVEGFWEYVLGDGGRDLIEDVDFARGFCTGALEVWKKVEDKII
jgi:hypothetical protein